MYSHRWLLLAYGVVAACFGVHVVLIVPAFLRLLAALRTGAVKWPGPRIHDPNPNAGTVRERLGVGYENLFPTFTRNNLTVVAVLFYTAGAALTHTPLLSPYIRIKSPGLEWVFLAAAVVGGGMAAKQVRRNLLQVNRVLADLATEAEPRAVEGRSAEAEYAIEHPLLKPAGKSEGERALNIFYESVRCHQDGDEGRSLALYQEAMRRDPSLHEHTREALARMLQGSTPRQAGPVYYWMGIHSEWLSHWTRAAFCYEKAAHAFHELGYRHRESKARCNLGSVKMQMHDPSAMEEWERSVVLDPRNGTAHLNIARTYYRISEAGDDRFERALDAFADAVLADPLRYGPMVMSSLRELGYTWKEDVEEITRRVESKRAGAAGGGTASGATSRSDETRPEGPANERTNGMKTSTKTLAFSTISYMLIAALAFLYIQHRAGFRALFSQTSPGPPPYSGSGFGIGLAVLFGIGACVCLIIVLWLAVGGQRARGGFVSRAMQASDERKATAGETIFSDYTRKPRTALDALRLQVTTLVRALLKILTVYLSVTSLNRVMMVVIVALVFISSMVWDRTMPMLWNAALFLLWFLACYRALLLKQAKATGVGSAADIQPTCRPAVSAPLAASVRSASTDGVTPQFIEEVLRQESVVQAIKDDLARNGQIGYKEVWRLGLITPDQDRFDPRPTRLPLGETMKKLREDANYRAALSEQIAPKRTAVLYNPTYLGTRPDSLTVAGGAVRPLIGSYPGWSYPLSTKVNQGQFVRLRDIRIDTDSPSSRGRSPSLPEFLREDGFPLKAAYADGDPLTADRGGTIVIDKGELAIIYPQYFVQRRLIDDHGDLVDLGLDEDLGLDPVFAVKMRPSVSQGLFRSVKARGYIPVLRYRSVPYAPDFFFPILDTPLSDSGWADLYIDTRGRGRLFIARQKTLDEWYEMMKRLRELLFGELAKKGYHLLGLTQDRAHLCEYMTRKQAILADYYVIRDWVLP